jgi:cell division protein FtsB
MSSPAIRRSDPHVLTVRRPLIRPTGDPRRLLRMMRSLLVRRVLALLAILVVLCLVQVWVQLQVVDIGYQLSAARTMAQRLDHEHRELQAELATLRSTLRDRAQATGMVPPQKGQVVELP